MLQIKFKRWGINVIFSNVSIYSLEYKTVDLIHSLTQNRKKVFLYNQTTSASANAF